MENGLKNSEEKPPEDEGRTAGAAVGGAILGGSLFNLPGAVIGAILGAAASWLLSDEGKDDE